MFNTFIVLFSLPALDIFSYTVLINRVLFRPSHAKAIYLSFVIVAFNAKRENVFVLSAK